MITFRLGWRRWLLALCLACMTLAGCGGVVELYASMTERDANEVLAALHRVGIEARKVPGKDGVVHLTVPQSEVAAAIAHLDQVGLPRGTRANMGDVFRKEGLISSPLEERARYLWALSQELSETLSQIDGVLRARVHVVLPERSTGMDPGMPSSAAVFIKHRPDVDLRPVLPQVKQLVASSIAGLTPERVSVVTVAAASAAAVPARPMTAGSNGANGANVASGANVPLSGHGPAWLLLPLGLLLVSVLGAGYAFWRRRSDSRLRAGLNSAAQRPA
ncbi:type III secretion system inner membrane ring lipoprotein SctJ [uncultured Hydrogenophaga sp.]|uniref:type III secretion system inner membrane ring lipoprotein SctJ n=1 Tax=uncultured Hydrogenophaga sp. TaxID=199683 RepID=UPI00265FE565|nr:type III secretion inner membrane ring lipoprotein SctJ [uncultured Hydrogenophaga sp.]